VCTFLRRFYIPSESVQLCVVFRTKGVHQSVHFPPRPKVILRQEREKKAKYGALCVAQRRSFTPLVFSVDGLLGKEATAASKRQASSLASKWKRSYSEVCGFVRSRLSIALVRSSSRCLRANRTPTHRFRSSMWDSGTWLGLYRM
jgi:hypothetical protein